MDKVLVHYVHNASTRCDGKKIWNPFLSLEGRRTPKATLAVTEMVTIKTKSRVWKGVVVTLDYHPQQKKKRRQAEM